MESRRGARVETPFFVAIDGIDAEPTLRHGDISATGVYFETRRDFIGGVGTIHWLYLVSADRAKRLRAMAYVVRTVTLADAGGDKVGGVAFEFMPESDEAQAALHDFVRHVLALRFGQPDEPTIAPRLDVHVGAIDPNRPAMVRQLSVRSMVLETSWAIQPGEKVRVDIVAPGMTRRIRLDGRAVRVAPKEGGPRPSAYDIEVEVQNETERPIRTHSSMTFQAVRPEMAPAPSPPPPAAAPKGPEDATMVLDDLLAALILPPEQGPKNRRDYLSGKLAQVRLPTLLSLIEMERMTGKLVLRRGIEESCIYVADGVVLDVEPITPDETRRQRLGALCAWDDGTFELHGEPVTRPNHINMRTTALLLDLARESDEASR